MIIINEIKFFFNILQSFFSFNEMQYSKHAIIWAVKFT